MPFYQVLTPPNMLTRDRKERSVAGITRIHCESTGAPPLFVQIQFDEVPFESAYQDGKPSNAIRLHGRMRAGRSAETKLRMLSAYTVLVSEVFEVPVAEVMVALMEISHENVMEGGVRLPAPGDEAAWLARHGVSAT